MMNRDVHTICVAIALCVATFTNAGAQTVTTMPITTSGVLAGSVTGIVSDVFAGRGVVGPYMLTWKAIDVGSERVVCDAQALVRGDGYYIDTTAGVLTFAMPLREGQTARVDYTVTPGKAAQNKQLAATAVPLNLLSLGAGYTLSALFRTDLATSGSATAGDLGRVQLALAGVSGKETVGQLTSRMYIDATGGNVLDRSGLLVREKKTGGAMDVTVGYARAGADFATVADSGLTPGREVIDASGTWKGARGISAIASFNRTADLTASGGGATVTTYTQQITAAGSAATKLQATHTTAISDASGSSETVTDVTHVQLDQRVGKTSTVSAAVDQQHVTAASATASAQTATITMAAQPSSSVSVQGSVVNRQSSTGAEDEATLQIKARVTSRIALTAGTDDRYGLTDWAHARTLGAEYTASARMKLTGGVEQRAATGRDSLIGTISADARPVNWTELTGTIRLRDVTANGVPDTLSPDTYKAGVTLSVGKGGLAKVTGAFALNPEDTSGVPTRGQSGTFGVTGKAGAIEASGSYSLLVDDNSATETEQIGLGLGWSFSKSGRLDTKYLGSLTRAASLMATDTYSLNLTHSIASRLDLTFAGSMTTQEQNGILLPNRDYRVDARIGMRF
jgi:hypothetical protein